MSKKENLYLVKIRSTATNPAKPELRYNSVINSGLFIGCTKNEATEAALKIVRKGYGARKTGLDLKLIHAVHNVKTFSVDFVREGKMKTK